LSFNFFGDTPPTVIGVMPPGVRFLPSPATAQEPNYNVNAQVDFWMPIAANPERLKAPIWDIVGRLRADATIEQARAELEVIAARQAKADPDFDKMTPQVQALSDNYNGDASRILLPLFGAAALVLLIACGNVAALLLARATKRKSEIAVRMDANGPAFTLYLQGSPADYWTDERFETGSLGFYAERGERPVLEALRFTFFRKSGLQTVVTSLQ